MLRILAALAALLAAPALAQDGPRIVDPYARVSGASATSGAIFLTIENHGDAEDRLVAASTPAAARAELHTHVQDANGVMAMTRIDSVAIPAQSSHVLERGGDHVMLLGLTKPLAQGDTIPLALTFERGGVITVDVVVDNTRAPGAMPKGHQHGAPSN